MMGARFLLILGEGRYWNSRYEPERYNFVQYAVKRGYSVFFYDRLGVGKSTKYVNGSV